MDEAYAWCEKYNMVMREFLAWQAVGAMIEQVAQREVFVDTGIVDHSSSSSSSASRWGSRA
jgi:hypothetical protein